MIYFNNDYSEGCHEKVLQRLVETNMAQTPGYGVDCHCEHAASIIKTLCNKTDVDVHFLVGGTQTNLTVIDAALRPHQGVFCAVTGHINVHETGAVEATGHKVLSVLTPDGKLNAGQICQMAQSHLDSDCAEHMVQPKMVYISNPTELGTIYRLDELEAISAACRQYGLFLFLDGARLGYGLTASDNDVTMADLARLCDVFYIGGTKVGALFGEAVVIPNPAIQEDFRYMIKQHGGMLAKGRLLGIQFEALLSDGTYFDISRHANVLADQIRDTLRGCGVSFLTETTTNQIFPILPDTALCALSKDFTFNDECRVDETNRAIRFCTSWATKKENVDALCAALKKLLN